VKKVRRREQGVILFVAVLILALMGALAIASLESASRDQQAAGYYNRSNTALFAAEAGVAAAIAMIEQPTKPACPGVIAFSTLGLPSYIGDATMWLSFGGQPKYYGDPAVANAVQCVGTRTRPGGSMSVTGGSEIVEDWRIYVVGESPDGSRARVEVMHEVIAGAAGY
jgi:hypothetical protein